MKKSIKLYTVLLLILFITLTACSPGGSGQQTTSATTAATTESTTVATTAPETEPSSARISLPAFSTQSPNIQDYDENDLTLKIEEMFNVDIEWVLAPSNSDAEVLEKQNILFASGDYPAIFLVGNFSQNDQLRYGQSGILLPLNDLIEEYGNFIKEAFVITPYLLKGVTALDDNIYSMPGLEECYHCNYSQKLYMNVDWLSKLGLTMPTTTEELYTVLTAFKEDDPNGNGQNDEIPLAGATNGWNSNPINLLMCSFAYSTSNTPLILTDGVVDIAANKPEWKDGLAYIKRLYSEGLIYSESFTQDSETLRGLANNPDTVILGAIDNGCCIPTVGEDGRWAQYEVVPPIQGPGGVQTVGYFGGNVGNGKFAITDKATDEQKIVAIQICNYFYSQEGALDGMYGPKGIGWWDAEPGTKGIDGKDALYDAIEPYQREDKRSVCWDNDLKYTPASLFNGRVQNQDITQPDGFETYLAVMTDRQSPYTPKETFPNAIWYQPEELQQIAQMKTDILEYIKTNSAQFVVGALNLDTDWDAYVAGFSGLGLDQYITASQKAYDDQYK